MIASGFERKWGEWGGKGGGGFNVWATPFSESNHAFFQIAAGLKFGIYDDFYCNLRKSVADEGTKMFRKPTECIIAALRDGLALYLGGDIERGRNKIGLP